MCRRAHIALEAREGPRLFEEPEYHDNLRGLESHECDKEIKDFWGFEKREGHEDSLALLMATRIWKMINVLKAWWPWGGHESDPHAHLVHSHGVAD